MALLLALPSGGRAVASHDSTQVRPKAIEPPSAVVIRLAGDEIIKGVILESSDGEIVVQHALLGRLVIPRSAIVAIESPPAGETPPAEATPPGGETPPAAAAPASSATPAAPARPVGEPPRPEWAKDEAEVDLEEEAAPPPGSVEWLANIQASLSGVSSENDEFDLRAAVGASRRTSEDLLRFDAEYYFSLLNGDTTDNNLLATLVYDRDLAPGDWLLFGKGQYQYDAFQSWEHRLSGYAGLGHRVFRLPPLALTLKVGAGATREFGDSGETIPEGYGEVAFFWRIDERQHLEGGMNIAPDLTDLGRYRILARLDWTFRFDPRGLALVGGVREEFQSQVPPGSTNSDFRYYAGIRLDF